MNIKRPKKINKGPSKIQSYRIKCKKFTLYLTGERHTMSLGVSRIEDGFSYEDNFCTIDKEQVTKLNRSNITIGYKSFRFYTVEYTDCEYSFTELHNYLKDLATTIDEGINEPQNN